MRVNTRYDDELTKGWGTRPSVWQGSAVLQHELRPGFGVLAGYYRTSYGNFHATDNLLLSPADYDPLPSPITWRPTPIAPSRGRNLGQCGSRPTCTAPVILPLIEPGTRFEDRLNQLDLAIKRTFHVGRVPVHGNIDAFNVFNTINVRNQVGTYGANWRRPTDVMLGRLLKFGAQLDSDESAPRIVADAETGFKTEAQRRFQRV